MPNESDTPMVHSILQAFQDKWDKPRFEMFLMDEDITESMITAMVINVKGVSSMNYKGCEVIRAHPTIAKLKDE